MILQNFLNMTFSRQFYLQMEELVSQMHSKYQYKTFKTHINDHFLSFLDKIWRITNHLCWHICWSWNKTRSTLRRSSDNKRRSFVEELSRLHYLTSHSNGLNPCCSDWRWRSSNSFVSKSTTSKNPSEREKKPFPLRHRINFNWQISCHELAIYIVKWSLWSVSSA